LNADQCRQADGCAIGVLSASGAWRLLALYLLVGFKLRCTAAGKGKGRGGVGQRAGCQLDWTYEHTSNFGSENIENAWLQLTDWMVINIAQLCMESRALSTSWLKEKIKAGRVSVLL